MIDYARARKLMVDTQLATNAVTDRRILSIMGRIPRERFVPEAKRPLAYLDADHKLTEGADPRYLAAPTPFARLVQLANIRPEDIILDVGCGTGYSTAVLAALGSSVVAIEEDPALVATANEILASLDIGNAAVLQAELNQGVPSEAPFDVIVIEGAVDRVPDTLFQQLRDHGRLVALVSSGITAVAHVYVKAGADITARREFNARMHPLRSMTAASGFVF